jgi:SAM-dependent methyltransferase
LTADARLRAPAAARNRGPILEVLRGVLPPVGMVLEVASGTGEHVAHFAAALPTLTFQPSDPDAGRRRSIDAWSAGLANVRAALALDATDPAWPSGFAAVLCFNMIHIAPWPAAEGLFRGARDALEPGGALLLYGPFRRDGFHTSPGNAAFDAELRARNPAWGLRDLEAVNTLAEGAGFAPAAETAMPANNLMLAFRRRS